MILLMTTAPPSNAPWYLGRKLPPLGLAFVAGYLEKCGFEVEILDNYMLNKPIEEVKQIIQTKKPQIVGMTCGSATYQRCIETAAAIKEVDPNCKVVVGGWHASYSPESLIEQPVIDYVVMGEGEQAMAELANYINTGKGVPDIAGVVYRKMGQNIKNPAKFIKDIDSIPFPARHLLPMDQYGRRIEFLDVEPVDIMSVTRGCPYSCAYCDIAPLWGKTCRMFSPKRIVDEMEDLSKNFGSKGVYLISDNFTLKQKETLEFCRELKERNLDMQWVCDTRVDLIDPEMLSAMKDAGCKTIWFGLESGSPPILKKINKGITVEQSAKGVQLCHDAGIQVACSFMIGIPGETIKDMETTLKFAKKIDPDWCSFNIFLSYPGSVLHEEVLANHYYDRVEDFIYYVKTKEFDFDQMMKIQRSMHVSFNRSPKRILRKIRREGALHVLKQVLKM
ncbi:MAG: B12-binding domain-containing radical SAM protein [Candidatus Bathyarchaeota archaeon]|nr:B12-binding domain-containing radical SAM protein [Candidatus Bathyarchaeota archaeon]